METVCNVCSNRDYYQILEAKHIWQYLSSNCLCPTDTKVFAFHCRRQDLAVIHFAQSTKGSTCLQFLSDNKGVRIHLQQDDANMWRAVSCLCVFITRTLLTGAGNYAAVVETPHAPPPRICARCHLTTAAAFAASSSGTTFWPSTLHVGLRIHIQHTHVYYITA